MIEVAIGAALFTTIVTTLVLVIVGTRRLLAPRGDVTVSINGSHSFESAVGTKLLSALNANGVLLPSGCGGRGTCGQCVVVALEGGGPPSAIETTLLSRRQLAGGSRLACQLVLREDLALSVPAEVLGVRKWTCRVRSSRNVATLMREIVLDLPASEPIEFRAGNFVQVTCPPYRASFDSFEIEERFRDEWSRLGLWELVGSADQPETRAYSIASSPNDDESVTLIVRIATPPPGAAGAVPPGKVSSYLFSLKPGDELELAGPYGTFFVEEGDREIVFVGGGAGIAPLRSMILDELLEKGSARKMSFWYGARNERELFYREEFERLQAQFPNFRYVAALSEADESGSRQVDTGFIHEILERRQLSEHPAPETCEYYLCGPPLMIKAVLASLERFGVDRENVRFDDFES
jgi:Na+-transporting NADH:ubiquinone oxidoreductase subunit F